MAKFEKFKYKSKNELKNKINELNLDIPWSNDLNILKKNIIVKDKKIPNRMAIHPMEGLDATKKGSPKELTRRRYINFSKGGSGLIWWEATTVTPEGKSNKHQLYLNENNLEEFKALINDSSEVADNRNGYKPFNILQLNHSGRYSKVSDKSLFLFHDPYSDKKAGITDKDEILTDDYLDSLVEKYVEASILAKKAGFDAVDIKACHRYLLSENLAAFKRDGKYGGEYINRVRLFIEIIKKVKKAVPDIILATRLNVYDAIPYPYGWGVNKDDYNKPDLSEPKKLVKELANLGVEIFSISASDPRIAPYIVRPYNLPVGNGDLPPEHPLEGCNRLFDLTSEIKKELPEKIVFGSGYSWLQQYFPWIAAGIIEKGKADMVGVGRMAFAYPDFAKDIIDNKKLSQSKVCITCSKCSELMIAGGPTGCIVRNSEPYASLYQEKVVK